jgi:hypothetical protein
MVVDTHRSVSVVVGGIFHHLVALHHHITRDRFPKMLDHFPAVQDVQELTTTADADSRDVIILASLVELTFELVADGVTPTGTGGFFAVDIRGDIRTPRKNDEVDLWEAIDVIEYVIPASREHLSHGLV